jgi:hypothetical protein
MDRITRQLMDAPERGEAAEKAAAERRANRFYRRCYREWQERQWKRQRNQRIKADAEQYYEQEIRPAIQRLFERREAKNMRGIDIKLVSVRGFSCARAVIYIKSPIQREEYYVSSQGELLSRRGTPLRRVAIGVNTGNTYITYLPNLQLLKVNIDNS